LDDNIWDRYVRIQEIIENQKEERLYEVPEVDIEEDIMVIEETNIVTQI